MIKKNGVILVDEKISIQKSTYLDINKKRQECLKFNISACEKLYNLVFVSYISYDKIRDFPHKFVDFNKYISFSDTLYEEDGKTIKNIKDFSSFKIMRVFDDIFILKIVIDKYDVNIKIIFDLSNYIDKNYGDVVLA